MKLDKVRNKTNKWVVISFHRAKETINKTKDNQWTDRKYLQMMLTNKGLISKTHKELIQLNIRRELNQKLGRRPKQTFLQRRHTDAQEASEKMLNIINYQRNAN